MPTPVGTENLSATTAVAVRITHGSRRFSFAEMNGRIQRDYLDESASPSVVRVVPLLRVFTEEASRRIAVGNVRIVVSGDRKVALEVFLEGCGRKET